MAGRFGHYALVVEVACSIVRFVDDHFPGWVEARITDRDGSVWSSEDKVPIFTSDVLRPDTEYPVPAVVRCTVIETDESSGSVLIDTSQPDGVTAIDGVTTRFWVDSDLVTQ